ncbi:MAG TPA: hypothetical protein VMC85_22445 [Desulfomonilaceae bacterium]|nr:hypothetical protein [Desulfomonilaceae bacterium]
MDKLENVLYSLLPLVLIILVSWLFSFLGSRMKKQAQLGTAATRPETEEDFPDFLSELPAEPTRMTQPPTGGRPYSAPAGITIWTPGMGSSGPRVTAEPIKPKMWGA